MRKISRRSFLASSVKAALFSGVGGFAVKGGAFAESVPWSNWSGGQTASLLAAMTSAAKTSSAVC